MGQHALETGLSLEVVEETYFLRALEDLVNPFFRDKLLIVLHDSLLVLFALVDFLLAHDVPLDILVADSFRQELNLLCDVDL